MARITINNRQEFQIETRGDKTLVNGKEMQPDIVKLDEYRYHVLLGNRSYTVEVLELDRESKAGILKVNGREYSFRAKDRYDELLEKLGMENLTVRKTDDLKAPMPGLVVKILVSAGQEVTKDDNLLVLEAMKMENIIRSPGDGKVKSCPVKPGDSVEKGQLLMTFE